VSQAVLYLGAYVWFAVDCLCPSLYSDGGIGKAYERAGRNHVSRLVGFFLCGIMLLTHLLGPGFALG
jgi:hypothetical protein